MENKTVEELHKLVSEIRAEGRECLYDISNKDYKNNVIKQVLWREISESMGLDKSACQQMWKNVRQKYRLAISKKNGPSGSCQRDTKPMTRFLLEELQFLRKYVENNDMPTVTNYKDSNTESDQKLLIEMAHCPDVSESFVDEATPTTSNSTHLYRKRNKISEAEKEFADTCKKLDQYTSALLETKEELDPFFLSLQKEFQKLPEHKQQDLKLAFLKAVFDALRD